ncbi:MAG: anti-sigma factor [Chloroflexi bacterium]|nr:anti-sigma factor [Chloroflexota bacterium]
MTHSQIQESIPLLALGGLAQAEEAELEQHLANCPACRALLSEYNLVAQELDAQVPTLPVPAQLETKLLQQLSARNARVPLKPAVVTQSRRAPSFWRQPVRVSRWAFALGALSLLILLGATAALVFQVQRSGTSNTAAGTPSNKLANLKVVSLTGPSSTDDKPNGFICLEPNSQIAMLWLANLQPLDATHTYQLWLIQNGQRTSGGLFRPGSDGRAIFMVNAPQLWQMYQEIGVTVEPEGGSPGPTTPRVIGGKLD